LKIFNLKTYSSFLLVLFIFIFGCNYVTYRTISNEPTEESGDDPEPNYDVTLGQDYQDFVTFMYMGNRSEMFGTFFNKFYQALEDYDEALTDYRTSTIMAYNRRLDSLNITPPISSSAKEKLNKVLERCSKIIQYNKSTRFLDDAVLLIGKSYFYMGEYLQAERKFSEFLSKLTKSNLYDEAILYLGKTKLKLGNYTDAEVILSNLFKSTTDNEIKSEITQELALLSISKNDYKSAVEYFSESINLTKDKEKKAEKQYILAKIYSVYKPDVAYLEYSKSFDLTSDFDLLFYSKLNEAKSLNINGKNDEAFKILDRLNGKYRDYPEMKELVELEIANTFNYQKKYGEARIKYFNVIIDYPSSKAAADAYYHLAVYSENVKSNYLNAYINYKKVAETNSASDFTVISSKRAITLDKYFSLVAVIKDSAKIVYPENEPDFIKHKEIREKEKGIEEKSKENPKGNENPPGPKGGGQKSLLGLDTLDISDTNNLDPALETIKTDLGKEKEIILKKELTDTLAKIPPTDTIGNIKTEIKKLSPEDSLILAMHIEDSIKVSKIVIKIDAYFQLAELFLYELNRVDSALFYLDLVVADSISPEKTSKALYSIASIYKNRNEDSTANEIYKKIILKYPNTAFANESRKILGIQLMDIAVDSAEVIFRSAEKKIVKNEYESAMTDLKKILNNYPADSFYVKSLYSVGWIFEYGFNNKDSSLAYYKKLRTDFPNSNYTFSINAKLDFYTSYDKRDSIIKIRFDTTGVTSDSLRMILDSMNRAFIDSLDNTKDSLTLLKESQKKGELKGNPDKQKENPPDKNKSKENSGEIPDIQNPKEK
jgi:TolA-binding protein